MTYVQKDAPVISVIAVFRETRTDCLERHQSIKQVVVVCGKNDVVKTSLEQGNWASNVHMHVKVYMVTAVSHLCVAFGGVPCSYFFCVVHNCTDDLFSATLQQYQVM